MIDIKKTYKTRNGKPVRILATDLGGRLPVAAAITAEDGSEHLWQVLSTGRLLVGGESNIDLIEVKPVREGWVNVYPAKHTSDAFHYKMGETRETADTYAAHERIACIKIQFTEGEGL